MEFLVRITIQIYKNELLISSLILRIILTFDLYQCIYDVQGTGHQNRNGNGNHDSHNNDKSNHQDINQAWSKLKSNDPFLDDDLKAAMLSRKKSLKIGTFDLCLDHSLTTDKPKVNMAYIINSDQKVSD